MCGSGFHPVRNVRISLDLAFVASAAAEDADVDEEDAEGYECGGLVVRCGGRCPCDDPCPWLYDAEVRPDQYAEGPAGCSLSLFKRSYAACRAWTTSAALYNDFARVCVDVWRLKPAGELELEDDGSVRRS